MASIVNTTHLYGRQVKRGSTPKPAAILQIPLDFTVSGVLNFSMPVQALIKNATGLDHIQSVKIDNSNNAANVTIVFDNGDVIVCPAYSQAMFPVFFGGLSLQFTAMSTGNVLVNITFTNTRENAQIWNARLPIAGTVSVTGSQVYTQPANGVFTDVSATYAGAGAQLLVAANGTRQLLQIRNPATPTSQGIAGVEPIYLGFSDPAVTVGKLGAWELLPGESLPQYLMTTTEAVYFAATTAGHLLTAKTM